MVFFPDVQLSGIWLHHSRFGLILTASLRPGYCRFVPELGRPRGESTDAMSLFRYHRCMEEIVIRELPEGTEAALRVRAARHHHSVEAETGANLAAGLSGEDVPMSVLLAADTGQGIEFDPGRLGLTVHTPEL